MRNAWLVSIAAACGASSPAKLPEVRINVETFAELALGPGNIAVTPDRRVFRQPASVLRARGSGRRGARQRGST
jgi:hypothetical protein